MAVATWAQARDLLREVVEFVADEFAPAALATHRTNFDAIKAIALYDGCEAVSDAALAHRLGLSALLGPSAVRALTLPILRVACQAINTPEGLSASWDTAIFRIWEYMHANTLSINAREFVRGAASAGGGNVGNGTIRRLSVDEEGYLLEGSHAETKTWECRSDQNADELGAGTAEKHREVFEVRGAIRQIDFTNWVGSGLLTSLQCVSSRETESWLVNPTFSQFGGTAPTAGSESTPSSTTQVTGWVLTSAAAARVSIDYAYRDFPDVTQTYSVKFTADNKITQTVQAQTKARLNRRVPMYMQVAIYRRDSATGNLTLRMGAVTRTVALSTLSNAAWNVVTIESSFTKNCYYRNFAENTLTIEIEVDTLAAGTIYIDDVIWVPWSQIDGAWCVAVGGATPFLVRDTFTTADTIAADSVLQYWLGPRAGNAWSLPSATGAGETITDP